MTELVIEVTFQQEKGTSYYPFEAYIYIDGKPVGKIITYADYEQGADGGYYRCIKGKWVPAQSGKA